MPEAQTVVIKRKTKLRFAKGGLFNGAFTPNALPTSRTMKAITYFHIVTALLLWWFLPGSILPSPLEMGLALKKLWFEDALGREILTSLFLNLEAVAIAAALSLTLAYSTAIPFFRPVVRFIAYFRFLGLAGLSLIFMVYVGGGHALKVSILVFSISVYYVTTLVAIVDSVTEDQKNYFRVLGMNEWQVVYHAIIRGKSAEMWEALRQNSAMGWMMLTTVEGLSKSEGGVGTVLLNSQRFLRLNEVYAIQFTLWTLGLIQDWAYGWLKPQLFAWVERTGGTK